MTHVTDSTLPERHQGGNVEASASYPFIPLALRFSPATASPSNSPKRVRPIDYSTARGIRRRGGINILLRHASVGLKWQRTWVVHGGGGPIDRVRTESSNVVA